MLRFLVRHQLNFYLYAPKQDIFQRRHWRKAYPAPYSAHFRSLIAEGNKHHLTFCLGMSPGLDIAYSNPQDRALLLQKMNAFLQWGSRCVALLFDDIPEKLSSSDALHYPNLAKAQADLANTLYTSLAQKQAYLLFLFVPTEYAGTEKTPYKKSLARSLNARILLLWTGKGVIPKSILGKDAAAFQSLFHRKPLLWDNFFANDFSPQSLRLDPYRSRSPDLLQHTAGILLNLPLQPYASQIPLFTFARYFRAPFQYDPLSAEKKALSLFGQKARRPLTLLAQNLHPSLPLKKESLLTASFVQKLYRAKSEKVRYALRKRLEELSQVYATLKKLFNQKPLFAELAPSAKKLSLCSRLGLLALSPLEALPKNFRAELRHLHQAAAQPPHLIAQQGCSLLLKKTAPLFR